MMDRLLFFLGGVAFAGLFVAGFVLWCAWRWNESFRPDETKRERINGTP